jgi:hypothetical protein
MKATVLQKRDHSFTTTMLTTEANQFRSELRGEGIKSDESVSTTDGKEFTAFSFSPKVAIEEIEILLETVGYGFTTNQIA